MDTGLIIAIVIAVIVLVALLMVLPRMRGNAQRKHAEREITQRRERTAELHRRQAQERQAEADRLEQEARARRAEAQAHDENATLHERGMADETLVRDNEPDLAQRAGFDSDRPRGGADPDTTRTEPGDQGTRRFKRSREVPGGRAHEPMREVPGGRAHEPGPDDRI